MRKILFAVAALVLLSALPTLAAEAPAAAPQAQPALAPAAPACPTAAVASPFAPPAPAASADVPVPEWLAGHHFTGYCPCGCSSIKNCSTSADCGGSPCSATISCC